MPSRTLNLDDKVYQYVIDHTVREHPVLAELREATAGMKHGGMQIGPDQGQFMQLLVKMLGAKRTIEVGVFTGYSSLAVALALPADGKVVACDVSEEWTSMARRYWEKAGVAGKIDDDANATAPPAGLGALRTSGRQTCLQRRASA